jgi:HEAT repeat protein
MATGQTPVDLQKILKAIHDKHVYVRRRAVATLGTIAAAQPEAIAAVETALNDPEAGVRSYAVNTLAKIGDSGSIDKIYEMLENNGNFMIRLAATGLLSKSGLSELPLDRTEDIIRGLHHENPTIRTVAVESLGLGIYRPSALEALLDLVDDPSREVRREVARTLRRYDSRSSGEALLGLLEDQEVVVRVMAASSLPLLFSDENIRNQAFAKLRDMFASFNDSYEGDGADWAWRHIGESLEKTGPQGVNALNEFLAQDADATLADHAWQILYVKLSPDKILRITPEEAQAGYEKHPKLRKNWNLVRQGYDGINNAGH